MLDDMLVFVQVVETGSFTKTADKLGSTVSRISKRVQLLESQLKTTLLIRNTRKLALTEAGRILYQQCKYLKDISDNSVKSLQEQSQEARGDLCISAPISLANLLVTPYLKEFTECYPEINLQLTYQNRNIDIVREGYDVAIICGERLDDHRIVRKIGFWNEIVCASPAYLKKNKTPRLLTDLEKHNCICRSYDNKTESKWLLDNNKQHKTIHVSGNIVVNTAADCRELGIKGAGIIKIAEYLVKNDIENGTLVHLFTSYNQQEGGVYFELPDNHYIPHKTKCFMDFFYDRIKDCFS